MGWREVWRLAALCSVLLLSAATASARAADPGTVEAISEGEYPGLVYVPTTYKPGAPLFVMTHGCQTTATQQMQANLLNPLAEREGFVVLYPDVSPFEANLPGPLNRCWTFPLPTSHHRDAGNPAALAGLTRQALERWRLDPERVYMAGMSAGAFMTSIMSAAYPDLFAAVAVNAGGAYADGTCIAANHPGTLTAQASAQMAFAEMGPRARVVPRLVSGGDSDGGIPKACADKAMAQGLRTNNLVQSGTQDAPWSLSPAETREDAQPGKRTATVDTYRDPSGCLVGERWTIKGMDHFWPGGSDAPESKPFTDPTAPSGAEFTWAFFKRFTKTGYPAKRLAVKVQRKPRTVRVDGRRVPVKLRKGRLRLTLPPTPAAQTVVRINRKRVVRVARCG